jgi:hypothetical protein
MAPSVQAGSRPAFLICRRERRTFARHVQSILLRVSPGMADESSARTARGRSRPRETLWARSFPRRARLSSGPHGSRIRSISRASENGLREL